ncbi:conserved membrane hypothetical protein [Hyella patelloides LEGE 07179]|uniref:Uncharacterized protein n=1 Tax=Hyella patelloides LEGE 07179 TaxID=945734 RepID=A0A563VL80_9CYAN|nr:hypothetical protein [Hyella patelloides]VEP12210.1 conserved membrane hypothetical protein [Hyella patelloides LEGE 07179]
MSKLDRKRKRVIYTILAIAIGNTLVTAAPWLEIEIIKKMLLTFANVVMFIIVWDAYFDEQLSQKNNFLILQDLFAVTCLSVITTFILSKGITKMIGQLMTVLGTLGLGLAGAISGLITAIIGVIWASYCDDLYRNSAS